jgi:Lrp/AsnC family transcriptional regulator for asnA, asnC and gidA
MVETGPKLDELDRRIVGALQVDGRVSWRRIAAVLGESERTIARRGTQLLESRRVVVTGMSSHGDAVLVRAKCAPGSVHRAATAFAHRPDTTFAYLLTGNADCLVELFCPPARLGDLVINELPKTGGLLSFSTHPVLRYFRTVHEWQPGLLTDDEVAALRELPSLTPPPSRADAGAMGREHRLILHALAQDGRSTFDELARIADVSEPTARRRVEQLRRAGHVLVRAVVEPALLGLPVEAILWIKTAPRHVDLVGQQLLSSPLVRYAAAIMGEHQILADVTVADKLALHDFVTAADWLRHVDSVETSLVLGSLKRSGVLANPLRDSGSAATATVAAAGERWSPFT